MAGQAVYPSGFRQFLWRDEGRQRPVMADVWYTARAGTVEHAYAYGPGEGLVGPDAALADDVGLLPLVVTSHGAGGSARNCGWLAESLARSGFIVLGVSHYGESPLDGPQTIDPRVLTQLWLRPPDLSFAISQLLADPDFERRVDGARIHAGRYAEFIPGATLIALGDGEGHFVYLNSCAAPIEANSVPLCRDRPGVDRDAVHAKLAPAIADFLCKALHLQ